jgi:hypothetical protein
MVGLALLTAWLMAGSPGDPPPPNVNQAIKKLPANVRDREDIQQAAEMATMPMPKTCKDQCDMVSTLMKKTCSRPHGGQKPPPTAIKKCEENTKEMVDACQASCKDKGKLDPDYIKSKIKMPAAPGGDADPQ